MSAKQPEEKMAGSVDWNARLPNPMRTCQTGIIIEDCIVYSDPYEYADEQLKKEREEELERQRKEEAEKKSKLKKKEVTTTPKVFKKGVGKYINAASLKRAEASTTEEESSSAKKKKVTSSGFGDFSSW